MSFLIHVGLNLFLMNMAVSGQKITKKIAINQDPLTRFMEVNKENDTTAADFVTPEPAAARTIKRYRTDESSKMSRATTTVPHILSRTCLLKPDFGPCRADIPMWYFDPATQNCSTFYWGGCQGNGNRFDRRSDCLATCLSKRNWKEPRPRYCFLNFDYGWCFGADERYYYDRYWKVCKTAIYSGCGGNKNNFYSKELCDDKCGRASFLLNRMSAKKNESVKKVLIINPNDQRSTKKAGTETAATSAPFAGDAGLTGMWWVDHFQKKVKYTVELQANRDPEPPPKENPVPQGQRRRLSRYT